MKPTRSQRIALYRYNRRRYPLLRITVVLPIPSEPFTLLPTTVDWRMRGSDLLDDLDPYQDVNPSDRHEDALHGPLGSRHTGATIAWGRGNTGSPRA